MRTEACLRPIDCVRVITATATALLACALLLGSSAESKAQDLCSNLEGWLSETDPTAHKYAPMYWFGPNELYFPTLPFHTAFDGIDNEGMGMPGAVDFADPGEVAPLGPNSRPSWDLLNADYVGNNDGPFGRLDRAAIFYRVQTLSVREIDDFWRFVISDEQAWQRMHNFMASDSLLLVLRSDTTQFLAIDYHAYFLRDLGLVGHNWDTEYSELILPADPGLAERFRVWIGAGHSERITNNVLVLTSAFSERERSRPSSMIVELGDHSMAPDIFPFGSFRPGLDVNWHTYKLWGVRDVQAQSGTGALGAYQPWMTYPRDLFHSAVLVPGSADMDSIRSWIEPGSGPNDHGHDGLGSYALVPGDAFACLTEAVLSETVSLEEVERWIGIIQRSIHESEPDWGFSGFDGLNDLEKLDAVGAMRRWFSGQSVGAGHGHDVKPEETLIWESKHYRSPPSAAYKQHLYRPTLGSLQRFGHYLDLVRVWLTWNAGTSLWLQTGSVVPAFWLPTRLPGYLALQLGAYTACSDVVRTCGDRWSFAGSLMHTGHYYALITWYARVSFVPRRDRVHAEERADWLIGGGVALTLPPFRARFGLTTDLRKRGIIAGATTWEIMISNI